MKILLVYLAAVSLLSVIFTVHDKNAACRGSWRVPEKTLFFLAFFGGAAAMWLTMRLIRHKTLHLRFMVGLPLIIILHFVIAGGVLYYLRQH